jgi:hypothetical protein
VEKATLSEFYENDGFFTTSCDPYMGHTFRLSFTHFTLKRIQRMAFKNIPEVIINLDKMLKD